VLQHAEAVGATEVETSAAAEHAWVQALETAPAGFIGGAECTPGYYNNEGQPDSRAHRLGMTVHPMGPVGFLSYIDEWRSSGRFEGLEIIK
jgi:cyclohexanone monooxygenase